MLNVDIDLLLGKDLLEKLGTRLKIGALAEIFIGEMPIGAIADEDSPEAMITGVMAEEEDSSSRGQDFDKKIFEGLSSS